MVHSNGVNLSDTQANQESPVVVDEVAIGSMQITDDLNKLLNILPEEIRLPLEQHPQLSKLIEVVMDVGRLPEARFPDTAEYLSQTPVSQEPT